MEFDVPPLLIAAIIAVLAPLVAELPLGVRLPTVVAEIMIGIIVGPHVLGWARPAALLEFLSDLGLIFLFFMAGMEIDLATIRGSPLRKGLGGWFLSLGLALVIAAPLYAVEFIHSPSLVAVALTTTAMGTILPILRDSGELRTRLGTFVLAAGILGELGPVVVLSLLMTGHHTRWEQTALMVTFVLITLLAAFAALHLKLPRIINLFARTMDTSSQLPIRIAVLVLMLLVTLAYRFGLDMILGAFAGGMVVGLVSREEGAELFRRKLDAIGYGFLIPMFFIESGMQFDLPALVGSPQALLKLPMFLLLFLLARGTPVVLYRPELVREERLAFVLFTATTLPLLVAIAQIGTATGRMRPSEASAMVGAGMLSVLIFPLAALAMRRRRGISAEPPREGRASA